MSEATLRQKRTVAVLIAKVATPHTADEASRLIRDLRREQTAFPILLEEIVAAKEAGDRDRLGRLLAELNSPLTKGWFSRFRDFR